METNPVENHINFVTDELLNSLNSLKEGKSYKKYNFIISQKYEQLSQKDNEIAMLKKLLAEYQK